MVLAACGAPSGPVRGCDRLEGEPALGPSIAAALRAIAEIGELERIGDLAAKYVIGRADLVVKARLFSELLNRNPTRGRGERGGELGLALLDILGELFFAERGDDLEFQRRPGFALRFHGGRCCGRSDVGTGEPPGHVLKSGAFNGGRDRNVPVRRQTSPRVDVARHLLSRVARHLRAPHHEHRLRPEFQVGEHGLNSRDVPRPAFTSLSPDKVGWPRGVEARTEPMAAHGSHEPRIDGRRARWWFVRRDEVHLTKITVEPALHGRPGCLGHCLPHSARVGDLEPTTCIDLDAGEPPASYREQSGTADGQASGRPQKSLACPLHGPK